MRCIMSSFKLVALLAVPLLAPPPAAGLKEKIDPVIEGAYRSALDGLPCRIKTRGKPKMLRWEEVDRCLNTAAGRVDWPALARELESIRAAVRVVPAIEFNAAVEASLSAQAQSFEKVFAVKDDESLLPLTNSVLKFIPQDSLQNLPVFNRVGDEVGTFLGPYSYERTGGLASANTYRLTLFQYTDRNGNVQSANDKLLLDSFGVPWKRAAAQPGFRLPAEKLFAPSAQ
ncbi:MAG: hypothetical protein DMG07_09275 [Acidobacteria bacterium]|nr:MAG: hypothetical protein DMG07_09275 [Acidobacteriota bacterium]